MQTTIETLENIILDADWYKPVQPIHENNIYFLSAKYKSVYVYINVFFDINNLEIWANFYCSNEGVNYVFPHLIGEEKPLIEFKIYLIEKIKHIF